MKKIVPLFILMSNMLCSSVCAQQSEKKFPHDRPRLVVGVVVDQMRYEYIPRFWDKFGKGGFKRLINQGYNFSNNHFNYVPTKTGPGHAAVYTGTTPSVNGIIGNDWYTRSKGKTTYVVADSSVNTVGASGNVGKKSPKHLLSTTVTDELKSSLGDSKVIGISIKDRGAILPAGHVADGAFWYDENTGRFVTSSWYADRLPDWVANYNATKHPQMFSQKVWKPLLSLDKYTESDQDNRSYEEAFEGEQNPVFPHNMDGSLHRILYSPYGNTLVREMTEAAIGGESLGQDEVPDFLAVSFSSTDKVGHHFGPNSIEVEDIYLRLDKELADLLDYLDQKVGKNNYVFFLTADHGAVEAPASLNDRGITGGFFDSDTAIDSLKSYLRGKYGEGEWVVHYMLQQVYLNHELMNEKNLNWQNMQNDVARFLRRFTGVVSTNTAYNFETTGYVEGAQAMYQRGYFPSRSGDVYIQLGSGWLPSYRLGTSHGSPYNYDTHVPLLFYGKGIPHGRAVKKTVIPQIAPTISTMLNITFPSGSADHPLTFD